MKKESKRRPGGRKKGGGDGVMKGTRKEVKEDGLGENHGILKLETVN